MAPMTMKLLTVLLCYNTVAWTFHRSWKRQREKSSTVRKNI